MRAILASIIGRLCSSQDLLKDQVAVDHRRRHRHRPRDRAAARLARRAHRDRQPQRRSISSTAAPRCARPGIDALAVQLDVRNPEQVDEMVERTVKHFGALDILVNNAAGNFICRAEELSPNGWNAVIGIVLNGSFYCSRAVGQYMIARKRGGSIVSILANYVWTGSPGTIHSAAAKAGVMSMTQTLAVEWARHGIRVNAVAPGPIESPGAAKQLWNTPDAVERITEMVPLRPLGQAGRSRRRRRVPRLSARRFHHRRDPDRRRRHLAGEGDVRFPAREIAMDSNLSGAFSAGVRRSAQPSFFADSRAWGGVASSAGCRPRWSCCASAISRCQGSFELLQVSDSVRVLPHRYTVLDSATAPVYPASGTVTAANWPAGPGRDWLSARLNSVE